MGVGQRSFTQIYYVLLCTAASGVFSGRKKSPFLAGVLQRTDLSV